MPYSPPVGKPAMHACRTPPFPAAVLSVPRPPFPPYPAHLQSCVHRNGRLQVIKLDERCDIPSSPHHLRQGYRRGMYRHGTDGVVVQASEGRHEGGREQGRHSMRTLDEQRDIERSPVMVRAQPRDGMVLPSRCSPAWCSHDFDAVALNGTVFCSP